MFSFRVFKPIDWQTASVEVIEDDTLVAEVFARSDGIRRLHLSEEWAKRGVDGERFLQAAPRITALLDEADAERRADGS